MKIKPLSIGNWVEHDGTTKRVDVLWDEEELSLWSPFDTWCSIYTDKYNISEVSGILLSEDVLELNFQRVKITAYAISQEMHIYKTGNEWGITGFPSSLKIKYVHELQQMLSFLGIEKEIKIRHYRIIKEK